MTAETKYNVINNLIRKGHQWIGSLSGEEIAALGDGIGGYSPRDVADSLKGVFHDDAVMERIVLETADRFGAFGEITRDVRLRSGGTVDGGVIDTARERYNAALANRIGVGISENSENSEITLDDPAGSLGEKATAWVEALPDFQVEEVAQRAGVPVFPSDVVGLVAPYYERRDLLKDLVKQSVEEIKPFGAFLAGLREWGELRHLDDAMAARTRRCYHALMATGLDIDTTAEVDRRNHLRAEHVTKEGILEIIDPKYTRPDRMGAVLDKSVQEGKSLAEFLTELRVQGELSHLSRADVGRIRRDYDALVIRARGQGGAPSSTPAAEAPQASRDDQPDRAVHGKWSQQALEASAAKAAGATTEVTGQRGGR